jgi:hypothetical protein
MIVAKAARPRKATHDVIAPTFGEPSTDVYRNMASIGNRLVEGWTALAAPLTGDKLRDAIEAGDVDAIVAGLDWEAFTLAANDTVTPVRHTLTSFARLELTPDSKRRPIRKARSATVEVPLPPPLLDEETPLDAKLRRRLFADVDQRALDFASVSAGRLITSVQESTKQAVREQVVEALKGAMTTDQLARRLRAVVPLSPVQAGSVAKIHAAAIRDVLEAAEKAGRAPTASALAGADKIAERAAAKKLRYRASLIARTEVVAASNQGRNLAWQSTVAAGVSAKNSVKEWIAAPDACDVCAAIDGEQVPWDQPFSTGDDMPPDHPACRCSAVLLPPDMANEPEDPIYATDDLLIGAGA